MPLEQAFVDLQQRFSQMQVSITNLCTSFYGAVSLPDPATRNAQQAHLDQAGNFAALVYIWALLDDGGFDPQSQWLEPDMRDELLAWKHVRHTGAHAPNGRANGYAKKFDDFMNCQAGTNASTLRDRCLYWDVNRIELDSAAAVRFYEYILQTVLPAGIANSAANKAFP